MKDLERRRVEKDERESVFPQTLQSPEECEQKGEENSGWVIFHAWQA
jgi:hypothetical protein